MWELLTGEALFDAMGAHYGDASLLAKICIACIYFLGVAVLVMMAISLYSFIMTGAPFVPTPRRLTREIVSLAGIRAGEIVYDLGCGDGRYLIEADRSYGATAIGIEISFVVCGLARFNAAIHRAKVRIHCANFNAYDFSDADVIFCYLTADQMTALEKRFRQLKKGCRILSRRFQISGWKPQRRVQIQKRFGTEPVYIYEI